MFNNKHFKFFLSLIDIDTDLYTDDGKVPHYEHMITYGCHIHFKAFGPLDGSGMMTHSLELKGTGCREAEELGLDWEVIMKYIHDNNLTVSTLHIASDIFTNKYFTMDDLIKKARKKEYISSFRSFKEISGRKGLDHTGTSLYFGSRDGNQINIYDKKNERYYKGYEVDTNYWTRIEIRLKSKAWDFVRLFNVYTIEGLPKLYFGILSSMLEFKSSRKATRIERRATWSKWSNFLKQEDKVRLYNQAKIESDLTKKKKHLVHSYGTTIIEVLSSMTPGEKIDFFSHVINEKISKLDNKSLKRINDERLKKGLPIFKTLFDYKQHILENGLI